MTTRCLPDSSSYPADASQRPLGPQPLPECLLLVCGLWAPSVILWAPTGVQAVWDNFAAAAVEANTH